MLIFLLLPHSCSVGFLLCRKDQVVVSKANVISEILYSISYEDNAPVNVSEFLLDNEIYTLDNFDLESYINWESYEDALSDLKYKLECIETIINNK